MSSGWGSSSGLGFGSGLVSNSGLGSSSGFGSSSGTGSGSSTGSGSLYRRYLRSNRRLDLRHAQKRQPLVEEKFLGLGWLGLGLSLG